MGSEDDENLTNVEGSQMLKKSVFLRAAFLMLVFVLATTCGQALGQKGPEGLSLLQAVGVAISLQPNILMQKEQVNNQQGVLQQARGKFDPVLKASMGKDYLKTPLTLSEQLSYNNLIQEYLSNKLTTTVGVEKPLRSGITIGPNMQVFRLGSNLDQFNLLNSVASNYSTFNFTIAVPLLKGLGKDVAAADETAADINLAATRLDFSHTVAKSVSATAQAYWQYLADKRHLDILTEAESRAGRGLELVQQLVDAKERPAADLVQVQANLAEKSAFRIAAEQKLMEAQKNLGLSMGIAPQEIFALPLPKDPFPEAVESFAGNLEGKKDAYIQLAEGHRDDLLAAQKREKSAEVLMVAAQKNTKPELNVIAGLGYAGLQEGGNFKNYLNAINQNPVGLNYSASVMLKVPWGNNAAKGQAAQKKAGQRQAQLQTMNLDRTIRANVAVALEAVKRHSASLKKAREAVALYQRGVRDEATKYKLGMSTIIDVITTSNRLDEARLTEVTNHLNYANAIIALRFETGTILVKEKDQYRVELKRLVSVPDPLGSL
jgi:outer membrane protein